MANSQAKMITAITKRAHANAARCIMVWCALALREEGFGSKRIKRVLEAVHKYAVAVTGKVSIEEQLDHIERVTGLRIRWGSPDDVTSISVEEIAELEELEIDEG